MKRLQMILLSLVFVVSGSCALLSADDAGRRPIAASGLAAGQMLSPEALLRPDGTLALNTGLSGSIDLRGWEVTLDSERGPVLAPEPMTPAAGPTWSALPHDGLLWGSVWAMALTATGELYVGGCFEVTADGSVTLNYVARYSGGAWSPLANNGLNERVHALAVGNAGELYVGGYFTQTADGSVTLNHVAMYSGGVWHPLANDGLDSYVYALAVSDSGDLYVGGCFWQTGDGSVTNMRHIARYSGGAWSPLASWGLNSVVLALVMNGPDLYAGGNFDGTGDQSILTLKYIARYASGAWFPLANNGLSGSVYALAVSAAGDLYAGGGFTKTYDGCMDLNHIARYSGGAWFPLGSNGLNDTVRTISVLGTGDLYVGGAFTQTADGSTATLGRIARYSGDAWSPLPNNGLSWTVNALAVNGADDLYAGGDFTKTADGSVTNLMHIARLSSVLPGPTINSITSKTSKPGKPATINGSGFSTAKSENKVYFGKTLAILKKATATKLTVTIPTKCRSRKTYEVKVVSDGVTSNVVIFKAK